jgi:hypothetical protein
MVTLEPIKPSPWASQGHVSLSSLDLGFRNASICFHGDDKAWEGSGGEGTWRRYLDFSPLRRALSSADSSLLGLGKVIPWLWGSSRAWLPLLGRRWRALPHWKGPHIQGHRPN